MSEENKAAVLEAAQNKQRKRHKIIIALSAVITSLVVIYVVMAVFFRFHTMFRTSINGISCSFQNFDQIKATMSQAVDNYVLELVTVDGQSRIIKGSEFGLECNVGEELRTICDSQKIFTWPLSLFKDQNINAELNLIYDQEKLNTILNSYDFMNPENMVAPQTAKLMDYDVANGFTVQNAIYGNTVKDEEFRAQVRRSILTLKKQLNLKEMKCYEEPEFTEDSEKFEILKKACEPYMGASITYVFGGIKETISKTDYLQWLTVNENNELAFDDSAVLSFVAQLGEKYNSKSNTTRAFKTSYGAIVDVPARISTILIDEEAEAKQLKEDILGGTDVSRAPCFQTLDGKEVQDFGNSYVEINLGMQHLFLYVDGAMVYECDIVSGNPNKGMGTPAGIFSVTYCARNAILTGPGYRTPVSYWMPFNGGIGIHDATWQPRFGYDRYLRNGSHGCINVSFSSAKTIYSYLRKGFPVICYFYGTASPEPGTSGSTAVENGNGNSNGNSNTQSSTQDNPGSSSGGGSNQGGSTPGGSNPGSGGSNPGGGDPGSGSGGGNSGGGDSGSGSGGGNSGGGDPGSGSGGGNSGGGDPGSGSGGGNSGGGDPGSGGAPGGGGTP